MRTMQQQRNVYLRLAIFLAILVVISAFVACSGSASSSSREPLIKKPLNVQVGSAFQPLRVNYVLVMPLESSPGIELTAADYDHLTQTLLRSLQASTSLVIANIKEEAKSKEVIAKNLSPSEPLAARAVRAGQELGAQGVLYGIISNLVNPITNRLEPPAEGAGVSFGLWLLDPATGKVLWSANYDKVNMPLTDNLLRAGEIFKGGLRYKSTDEMIDQGFTEASKSLENLRHLPVS